ncbi:MAG TPA: hypothetical protein VHZ76_04060 [Gammaproteobacteria bacterium]|jgi:integrase|nr:hypothetical protein [Gammaproteobacteria bacterium]
MEEEEPKVAVGFDRGVDYENMRGRLTKNIKELHKSYNEDPKKITLKRIIYSIIACIQLRNGARISEAVVAFCLFIKKGAKHRVTVKISKSDGIKVNPDGTRKQKKIRYRELMFPISWIDYNLFELVKKSKCARKLIETGRLKKRVLDYMLINFQCNTHSLRYAFINYMIYIENKPLNDVAKFVGHINTNQLTTYTQTKNTNKIFDLDI